MKVAKEKGAIGILQILVNKDTSIQHEKKNIGILATDFGQS